MVRQVSILAGVIALGVTTGLYAASAATTPQNPGFRLPHGMKIISITPSAKSRVAVPSIRIADDTASLPQPPMGGFSPLVAIVTSDRHTADDDVGEQVLASSYVGKPLNAPAEKNFVVGILDTGSVVDLAAGDSATLLGLKGSYLTANTCPLGGVGGSMDATITKPIGYFAAGLGAIKADGQLDLSKLVGHTNVAALVSPPIDCGGNGDVSATLGNPLLAFYTTIINVNQPRRVVVRGQTYFGPDIQILSSYTPSTSVYRHKIPLELGGMEPVTTASYFAFPDLSGDWWDLLGDMVPMTPTMLSMMGGDFPMGGAFFVDVTLLQGQTGPLNLPQTARMMLDTGAQSSIISSNIAAKLNLPIDADFRAEVCGVGGVTDVPGYYVDYVQINAMGGALQFAHVPFLVIDLDSPEGGSLDGILGTNFFWNRNVVLQPDSTGTGFLHISDPVPYACADLNGDALVDAQDFAIFAAAWQTTPADPAWNPLCDFYADGVVDARDLQAFLDAWTYALAK
jgi:hypothetical protein